MPSEGAAGKLAAGEATEAGGGKGPEFELLRSRALLPPQAFLDCNSDATLRLRLRLAVEIMRRGLSNCWAALESPANEPLGRLKRPLVEAKEPLRTRVTASIVCESKLVELVALAKGETRSPEEFQR